MESFYKTSIDLSQKPFLTQISNNTLYKNYNINIQSLTTSFQNLKTSSNSQNCNIMEKRKQILNNLFPYHIFNKFSVSFEKYLLKNNLNIPVRIKLCKDKLSKEEELLQKIDNKKNEELLNKANYGHDFFIQFAKKNINLTKGENKKDIKLPKSPFRKRFSTSNNLKNKQGQKKIKRPGFYEIILKEVNDEYEEIIKAKSLEKQKEKSNKINLKKKRIKYFKTFDNLDDINNNNNNKKDIYSNLLKNRNKTNTKIINKKLVNKINNQFPKIINLKKKIINIKTNRNNNDKHSEKLHNFFSNNNHNNKTITNRKINSFIKYNKERYKTLNTNIMSNYRNNKHNFKYSLLDSKKSSSNLAINNKTIPNKNINNNF